MVPKTLRIACRIKRVERELRAGFQEKLRDYNERINHPTWGCMPGDPDPIMKVAIASRLLERGVLDVSDLHRELAEDQELVEAMGGRFDHQLFGEICEIFLAYINTAFGVEPPEFGGTGFGRFPRQPEPAARPVYWQRF